MTSRSLLEDTFGDKVVRFVIGAVLAAAVAFWTFDIDTGADYARHLGLWAVIGGSMAAVFGNRFLELFIEKETYTNFPEDYAHRPWTANTAGDRVMFFVIGAAWGAGIVVFGGGVKDLTTIAVWALAGGAACALLGYRLTRFFWRWFD
jgi:hypothetical protein